MREPSSALARHRQLCQERHPPLAGKELRKVVYRGMAKKRLGGDPAPNLRAVLLDERPAVYYSREDITHGLLGTPSLPVDGYDSESAFAVLRNIVLTSMPKP